MEFLKYENSCGFAMWEPKGDQKKFCVIHEEYFSDSDGKCYRVDFIYKGSLCSKIFKRLKRAKEFLANEYLNNTWESKY